MTRFGTPGSAGSNKPQGRAVGGPGRRVASFAQKLGQDQLLVQSQDVARNVIPALIIRRKLVYRCDSDKSIVNNILTKC